MTTAVCPRCGEPLALRRLPASRTGSGPVTAAADPREARICGSGCAASHGLDVAFEEALAVGLTLATGTPREPRCSVCDAALDLPMRATLRSVTVAPPDATPFTVTFGLPLVRCGECGTDNVPPGVIEDVRASGRAACGLPPMAQRRTLLRRLRRRGGPGSP